MSPPGRTGPCGAGAAGGGASTFAVGPAATVCAGRSTSVAIRGGGSGRTTDGALTGAAAALGSGASGSAGRTRGGAGGRGGDGGGGAAENASTRSGDGSTAL